MMRCDEKKYEYRVFNSIEEIIKDSGFPEKVINDIVDRFNSKDIVVLDK